MKGHLLLDCGHKKGGDEEDEYDEAHKVANNSK